MPHAVITRVFSEAPDGISHACSIKPRNPQIHSEFPDPWTKHARWNLQHITCLEVSSSNQSPPPPAREGGFFATTTSGSVAETFARWASPRIESCCRVRWIREEKATYVARSWRCQICGNWEDDGHDCDDARAQAVGRGRELCKRALSDAQA